MKTSFLVKSCQSVVFVLALALILVPSADAEVIKVVAHVRGMACPFCAYGVEKKLKKVTGVRSIDIDIQRGLATLEAAEGRSIAFDQVPGAIRDAGFTPDRIVVTGIGQIGSDKSGGLVLRLDRVGTVFNIKDPNGLTAQYKGKAKKVEITGTTSQSGGGRWVIQVEKIKEIE